MAPAETPIRDSKPAVPGHAGHEERDAAGEQAATRPAAPVPSVPSDDAAEALLRDAVRAARREGRKLRVIGGGTSAIPPRDGATALTVGPPGGIVSLRPADGVLTVRAGTPIREVVAALRATGRRLPLRPYDPGGRATIGGAVASADDGLTAREGFRWRDVVLGARAVLGTGECVRVGASVVKSVAGFDVVRLLVASRGTIAAITCLDLRLECVPECTSGWRLGCTTPADVACTVAAADALGGIVRGLVASPRGDGTGVDVDVLLEGPSRAVAGARAALLRRGFEELGDAGDRWASLTARGSAPPPAGLVRRTGRIARHDPVAFLGGGPAGHAGLAPAARSGAQRSGGWVADVLRSRITWIDIAPPPPCGSSSGALFRRVTAAFDPDGVFQPGRGYGHP